MIRVVSSQNPLFSMKIFIAGHFLSDFPDGSASCDKAALSHWATELHKRGWISFASSEHAGSGFDACPPFFPLPALHDKIASCANWSTLKTLFSAASSHCSTSALFFYFFFFNPCPHFYRGNFTVPKLSESNMGFGVLGVFLGLLLEVSTHGPHAVPRTSWRHQGRTGLCMVLEQSRHWINKVKQLNIWFSAKCEWAKRPSP